MTKVFLLGANKEIDRAKQVVEVNQIIQMEGYDNPKYVVYEIVNEQWGIDYKLINLKDYSFNRTRIICPLSEKFGIGFYFTAHFLKQFGVLLDSIKSASTSYMLLAGTEKENFNLLREECGEFTLEELMQMKKFTSFDIIQTSQGVRKFISELPKPL